MIACGSTFTFAAVQEAVGKNTTNSIYFWGTKPTSKRKRELSINDSLNIKASASSRIRGSSAYDDDSGISDAEVARNSISAQNRESSGFLDARSSQSDNSRAASGKDGRKSLSALSRKFVPETRKLSGGVELLANSVFQDMVDKEIDDLRRSNLKSLFKGSNTQTLNLVPKENIPYVLPHLTFKFQSVGNIEGCDDEEEYPVVLQDIKCFQDHVIFHLETTAPPPKKRKVLNKLDSSCSSATSAKEESSENSEADTTGEIPTWIRNELEYGIPVSESGNNASPGEDEKSKPTGNNSTPARTVIKRRSLDSLNRRNSSLQRRDPNFNLIPKIQRQVTLLKLTEKSKTNGASPMTETQIIDGVAVSKSIAEVQNQLISPCPSDQQTEEEKTSTVNTSNEVINIEKKVQLVEVKEIGDVTMIEVQPPPPRTSLSPDISASRIPKLKSKLPTEESLTTDAPNEMTPVEVPNKKGSPTRTKLDVSKTSKDRGIQQKGRLKRNLKVEPTYKSKVLHNAKDKIRGKDVDDRVSSASDIEDARVRRRMKDRKKEDEKNALEEAQRIAKISEERLVGEMRELREEKVKREERLKVMHEQQMKEREEQSRQQIELAKKREELLKDEILGLKTDLNNQNSKLQDNYNILLSLQEQLLRMQQHQLRSTPDFATPRPTPSTPKKSSTLPLPRQSSICLLM